MDELKKAFPDVVSKKLNKISLVNLKHSYVKINDYIASFRKLTADLEWPEEPLVLFFYNGLHLKFKEEINKMENFLLKMEEITTKCILFESSQNTKIKINQFTSGKPDKKKTSNSRQNNNNGYNNKLKNYNNFKRNSFNKPKNSSSNTHVTDVQKISSKN